MKSKQKTQEPENPEKIKWAKPIGWSIVISFGICLFVQATNMSINGRSTMQQIRGSSENLILLAGTIGTLIYSALMAVILSLPLTLVDKCSGRNSKRAFVKWVSIMMPFVGAFLLFKNMGSL